MLQDIGVTMLSASEQSRVNADWTAAVRHLRGHLIQMSLDWPSFFGFRCARFGWIRRSTRSLNHLADLIRAHRNQRRSRWRRLDPRPASFTRSRAHA